MRFFTSLVAVVALAAGVMANPVHIRDEPAATDIAEPVEGNGAAVIPVIEALNYYNEHHKNDHFTQGDKRDAPVTKFTPEDFIGTSPNPNYRQVLDKLVAGQVKDSKCKKCNDYMNNCMGHWWCWFSDCFPTCQRDTCASHEDCRTGCGFHC